MAINGKRLVKTSISRG